jgi:hypothetical protein
VYGLVGVLAIGVVFAAGIMLGESLHDTSLRTGTQTLVRTLDPLPIAPAEHTVTMTVTTSTAAAASPNTSPDGSG